MDAYNADFIKSIHFEKIEIRNSNSLNKKLKEEFYSLLTSYGYRSTDSIKKYLWNGGNMILYCSIDMNKDHEVVVYANETLIEIFKNTLLEFDNTQHLIQEEPHEL